MYSKEKIEQLISYLAMEGGSCPSENGFEDLPDEECDMNNYSNCEKCWKQALKGD